MHSTRALRNAAALAFFTALVAAGSESVYGSCGSMGPFQFVTYFTHCDGEGPEDCDQNCIEEMNNNGSQCNSLCQSECAMSWSTNFVSPEQYSCDYDWSDGVPPIYYQAELYCVCW